MAMYPPQVQIQPPTPTGAERRADARYELAVPGLVADIDGCYDCKVVDLSLGGCMLEGSFEIPDGAEVAVGFDSLIGLVGQVVHAGPGFVGIKFRTKPDRRDDIRIWIANRLRLTGAQVRADQETGQ